jgi:hypothetical protein
VRFCAPVRLKVGVDGQLAKENLAGFNLNHAVYMCACVDGGLPQFISCTGLSRQVQRDSGRLVQDEYTASSVAFV